MRSKTTIYACDDAPVNDPEGERSRTPLVEYDPHDDASLMRAREAVRDRFSLPYLPVLCSEPEPTLWGSLRRAASRSFGAWLGLARR